MVIPKLERKSIVTIPKLVSWGYGGFKSDPQHRLYSQAFLDMDLDTPGLTVRSTNPPVFTIEGASTHSALPASYLTKL